MRATSKDRRTGGVHASFDSPSLSPVRVVARLGAELARVPIDTRANRVGFRAVAKQKPFAGPRCPTNAAAPTAILVRCKGPDDGAKERGTGERVTREVAHRVPRLTLPSAKVQQCGADREMARGSRPSHPA